MGNVYHYPVQPSTFLAGDVAAGGTVVKVPYLPREMHNTYGWMAIGVGGTACEVRRIAAYSGGSVSWAGTLDYAHSAGAPILYLREPALRVEYFGAKASNSAADATANTTAINRAFVQAGGIYGEVVGGGIYHVNGALTCDYSWVGLRGILQGGYRASTGLNYGAMVIKSTYAGAILRFNTVAATNDVTDANNQFGNRVQNVTLVGDGTNTTIGLQMVHCNLYAAAVKDVLAQECTETNFDFDNCWGMPIQNIHSYGDNAGTTPLGIRVRNGNAMKIQNFYIRQLGGTATGIYVTNPDGFSLDGGSIENTNRAVHIDGDVGAQFSANRGGIELNGLYIEQTTGYATQTPVAVYVEGEANSVKISNSFVAWGYPGYAATCVHVDDADKVEIDNCSFFMSGTTIYHVVTTANSGPVYWHANNSLNGQSLLLNDVGDVVQFDYESLWLNAEMMYAPGIGSATLATIATGSSTARVWTLTNANSVVSAQVLKPRTWKSGYITAHLYYCTPVSGAATLALSTKVVQIAEGTDVRIYGSDLDTTPTESAANFGLKIHSKQSWGVTLTAGARMISVHVLYSNSGSSSQSVHIVGVELRYSENLTY